MNEIERLKSIDVNEAIKKALVEQEKSKSLDNLLPCPFCGGIGTLWSIDKCDTVYAVCQDCGTRTVDYKYAATAIAAWNRRDGKDINVTTKFRRQQNVKRD